MDEVASLRSTRMLLKSVIAERENDLAHLRANLKAIEHRLNSVGQTDLVKWLDDLGEFQARREQ